MSAPPIISWDDPAQVRKVKFALAAQILQSDDNFLIFSHRGISSKIFAHPFFSYVPFKADIITIFPALAAISENSTT